MSRPWDKLYNSKRWRVRSRAQLRARPLCAFCLSKGQIVSAQVADHVDPHRGDPVKFFEGPLQSLCEICHNGSKQQVEKIGYTTHIGIDGWPLDPRHPANKSN